MMNLLAELGLRRPESLGDAIVTLDDPRQRMRIERAAGR
jgi:hypothetical protein